ncbi:MAG: hypothetical protein KKF62_06320 [Bacteroidetes bacterium]|nr:hypothetical protein [Bacteroidota bacterium]MBU1117279.1 hypothetical protein [Bacteroidota bacterium]MBU1797381.1 hypothetical protein [Bacteroidota bacterium]
MKDILANNIELNKKNRKKWASSANNYLWEPIKSGIYGFAIFITILIFIKFFSYLIGSYSYFEIEITDIQLSLIGFVLLFLIRFLENFKEPEH